MEKQVVMALNSQDKKMFFEPHFNDMPKGLKEELRIEVIRLTNKVKGIIMLSFATNGNVVLEHQDAYVDDIEGGRPETITYDKLLILNKYNIGRISINPQTFEQRTLDLIGRNHTVENIYNSYELVRQVGNFNINMDIILGLPNENIHHVKNTISNLEKLSPENITIHTMAIKTASELKHQNYKADESTIKEMIDFSQKKMKSLGYIPYYMYRQKNILGNFENVGYTKPNKACIYNVQIMEEAQTIIGLGAGASSKFIETKNRFINVKGIEEYIARIDEMITKKQNLLLGR
ncbi:hypothetical protein AN642_00115 [Epulopiscium sp. SCG-B10WGA-EpuloA2]|nr:hypothetical protein AN642_00115 [Epulopiscium sp. SCG-B10WGA-EpuloA2]